ncbi:hypothetical protein [Limnobacter sp.]|uniref:hypothetical protein n=1 Tax=Limnobacter sp. TaxID=2003368 RepID=UPI0037499503
MRRATAPALAERGQTKSDARVFAPAFRNSGRFFSSLVPIRHTPTRSGKGPSHLVAYLAFCEISTASIRIFRPPEEVIFKRNFASSNRAKHECQAKEEVAKVVVEPLVLKKPVPSFPGWGFFAIGRKVRTILTI